MGGTEAQVTVNGLANQGYHWRARVLDGNGVPSTWVSFSGNASDFTVGATYPPSSLFSWSPDQIFIGDSVNFSVEETGAGFTYGWNFGGSATASGATASQSFSQAGNVTVTLTVTDAHGNQSQHSETITVLSKALVDQINTLAQQTEGLLDQVTLQAQAASSVSNTSKLQPDFVRHCTNRRLSTETVLNYLRTRLPRQYEVAEVVGKWVWLDISPARKPGLASVLWALGFHWNQRRGVWQHPCGSFNPFGIHPADPRAKYRSYFPADMKPA
jgi:hypothetical protein